MRPCLCSTVPPPPLSAFDTRNWTGAVNQNGYGSGSILVRNGNIYNMYINMIVKHYKIYTCKHDLTLYNDKPHAMKY